MLEEKSPSPTNSNYDFALRHERVKLLEKTLKQLHVLISRTVLAMREVTSCLSLVGQSYHEVAQCIHSTHPHSTVNQYYSISTDECRDEMYGANLQNAAMLLSTEMMSISNGEPYSSYNGTVHQKVLRRLHDVMGNVQKARGLGDDVKAALKKAMRWQKIVHQKEVKYMRKGLALTQSKLYAKQAKKMREHDEAAEAKRRAFDAVYESLMQRHLYLTGHSMSDFFGVNAVYVSSMLKVLGCLAPNGPEGIQKMVDSDEQRDERLEAASKDQLCSQLRTRGVRLLGGRDATLEKGGTGAWPDKEASAMSNCNRSSHNFTGYYEDHCPTNTSAERAPPTARAHERGSDESNERCRTLRGTPQQQLISSQAPMSATSGTTGVSKATSGAFSTGEPYASPPLRAPSFPAALRRADPLAIDFAALGRVPGTASYTGKQTESLKSAAPATVVLMTGGCHSGARDATTMRSNGQIISHAPFADTSTPTVSLPAARFPLVTLPAQCNEERLTGKPWDRSAVLAAQAAMFGAGRARFANSFDDNPVTSTRERTPRMSLPPMELFPLDVNEACSPRHLTPRVSTATTVAADAVAQQHPGRDASTVRGAAALSKGGVPRPCTASAPPDEDTVTSSVTTQCRERSESSLQGRCTTHGRRPPPQQQRRSPLHSQGNAAPKNLAHFQAMTLEGGFGASSYQWCSDGLDSEAGGVSGRSHNVSTNYGMDSPVRTPQRCALDTCAWEDAQVRPCGPV